MTSESPTAIVIGEALIDIVTTDTGAVEHAGGSPMNVSFGLARLGMGVGFLARIGGDARGELIRHHLESAGVRLLLPPIAGVPTSTANAVIGPDGAATYVFDIEFSLEGLPDLPPADVVHFGSLGAILEPGATTVYGLVAASRDHATISYDPNVRAKLQGDVAAARDRAETAVRLSDLVKASDEDVEWLYPGSEPADVAAAWVALGAGIVVVTAGSAGATVATADGVITVPSYRVDVVDTIGAGDSFMAALIGGLGDLGLLGAERRDALAAIGREGLTALVDRAARAAAITVSRAGAEPPTRAELDAFAAVG
ncbi:MAG: carbohydrate kinase [Burkholderiaceae bacterium]|nr:carbohydrate kinase [Microbacteriaceae bacterium]